MNIDIKLVVFSIISNKLFIYLPERRLPFELLKGDGTADETAESIFKKYLKIPLANIYYEQLYTFSKDREISVVYYFLVPEHKIYQNSEKWYEISNIITNKNDQEIVNYAVQRLRWKIEYTNAVYSLLPDEFTFSQLQSTYEAILGKTLDKRNFRKKILALNILKATGHKKREGRARPAEMFAFRKKELTFVKILQPSS